MPRGKTGTRRDRLGAFGSLLTLTAENGLDSWQCVKSPYGATKLYGVKVTAMKAHVALRSGSWLCPDYLPTAFRRIKRASLDVTVPSLSMSAARFSSSSLTDIFSASNASPASTLPS